MLHNTSINYQFYWKKLISCGNSSDRITDIINGSAVPLTYLNDKGGRGDLFPA